MNMKKFPLFMVLVLLFVSFTVTAPAMGDGDDGGVLLQTVVPPSIISGGDGVFTKGSSSGLDFGTNASTDDLEAILIDGHEIDSGDYTISGEPFSVTLKVSFLQTLPVGHHTVKVKTSAGSAEADFSVKNGQSDSPATGDSGNMLLWAIMLFLSAGLFITFVFAGKHKKCSR